MQTEGKAWQENRRKALEVVDSYKSVIHQRQSQSQKMKRDQLNKEKEEMAEVAKALETEKMKQLEKSVKGQKELRSILDHIVEEKQERKKHDPLFSNAMTLEGAEYFQHKAYIQKKRNEIEHSIIK